MKTGFEELPERHQQLHAMYCQKEQIVAAANERLAIDFRLFENCEWHSPTGNYCGKGNFESIEKQVLYVLNHIRNRKLGNICRFGTCKDLDNPLVYSSGIALYGHFLTEHKVIMSWTTPPSASTYIHWCGFCSKWLSQLDEDIEVHAKSHVQAAVETILADGYNGVFLSDKMISPAVCMFCFHNKHLDWSVRLKTHYSEGEVTLGHHIYKVHMKELKNDSMLVCSGSVNGVKIPATCGIATTFSSRHIWKNGMAFRSKKRRSTPASARPKKVKRKRKWPYVLYLRPSQ